MSDDIGASASADRAFVPSASSPQAVSPVPASIPSAEYSRQAMLGYGFAAYCAGWRAAVMACTANPARLAEHHARNWFHANPPTELAEPVWRVPLAAQGIEARSDETLQAAQPEGQEPGAEGMRPDTRAARTAYQGASHGK